MVFRSEFIRGGDSSRSPKSPTWGLETAVDGRRDTRVVLVNELHNFRRLTHNRFNFYLTIIDQKHPKFVRNTDIGERWRMRFNVFGSGCFAEWLPNSLLHLGELHVYYELRATRYKPWCDDFTFYYDKRHVDEELIPYRYQMMMEALKDSLVGYQQHMKFLLYLPIDRSEFIAPNKDLDEFLERQDVMLAQLDQLKKSSRVSTGPALKAQSDPQKARITRRVLYQKSDN